jgi:hypothetical protein
MILTYVNRARLGRDFTSCPQSDRKASGDHDPPVLQHIHKGNPATSASTLGRLHLI